jgi:hypothetical protein
MQIGTNKKRVRELNKNRISYIFVENIKIYDEEFDPGSG